MYILSMLIVSWRKLGWHFYNIIYQVCIQIQCHRNVHALKWLEPGRWLCETVGYYIWLCVDDSFLLLSFFFCMASNLLFHIRNQVKMLHTNFPGPHWAVCGAYTRGEFCMGNGCCNKNCLHGHPGKYCLNCFHGHPDILFASRISRQFLMTFSSHIRI